MRETKMNDDVWGAVADMLVRPSKEATEAAIESGMTYVEEEGDDVFKAKKPFKVNLDNIKPEDRRIKKVKPKDE